MDDKVKEEKVTEEITLEFTFVDLALDEAEIIRNLVISIATAMGAKAAGGFGNREVADG